MKEQLLNEIGAVPDRLMNLAFLVERRHRQVTREAYEAELDFYAQPSFREQKQFFSLPDAAPSLEVVTRRDYHGGTETLYRYSSDYSPRNPGVTPRFLAHVPNRSGYLFVWNHPRPANSAPQRPLVLCVHGFRMGHPRRAKAMFKVRKLFEMGMDVALFIQPHHWKRADDDVRQHFFNGEDLPLTLENVGQAVHDLHACYLALQQRGYGRIGLIGGSLGGLVVTLYATLTDDPEFVFSVVPAIRIDGHLDPARSKLSFPVDETVRQKSFRALDLIDPSFYRCKLDKEHFGVVYHRGDRINDARPTEKWVQDWQMPHVWSLPGGHWVVFDSKLRGQAWYGWLHQHGFA